jgi:ABC-type sugar transport system substrate-binding protein
MFGANEGSAIGVVNGAKELGRQLVIIGYDSGAQQKAAIRDGQMAGAITQNPVGIGYKTVEAAVKAQRAKPSKRTSTPASTTTTSRTSISPKSQRCCTTDPVQLCRRRSAASGFFQSR